MTELTERPSGARAGFLNFPLQLDLDALAADFAILGVPRGVPYTHDDHPNDQSKAPNALRDYPSDMDIEYTLSILITI